MSDGQLLDENSFAYFWGWLIQEEKVEEKLFRLIRTTPGLVDQSWMVENMEKTVKELIAGRVSQLKDLMEGWIRMDSGMTKEIAIQLFNEFMAGSRTLGDFENRNFSRKKEDQQAKPRESFPLFSSNPMFVKAPISEMQQNGGLPTSSTVFSPQSEDFYSQSTNDLYYDMVFGDAKILNDIIKDNNRSPNMPVPKVHPMPYHPHMNQQTQFQQFQPPAYAPMRVPVSPYQQMQYVQTPMAYPAMQMPQYMPMAIPMPMQAVPENMYAGLNYQQVFIPNGHSGNYRGNGYRNMRNKGGKAQEQQARNQNAYENANTSSSSSTATNNKPRSPGSEEESTSNKLEENTEEAFPPLNGQEESTSNTTVSEPSTTTSETGTSEPCTSETSKSKTSSSDLATEEASATETSRSSTDADTTAPESECVEPDASVRESVVIPTRKFSDVVGHIVSASSLSTSDALSSIPVAEESKVDETVENIDLTTALVVDTTESNTPVAAPFSHRTVAEVVQQSLSSAPSPAKSSPSSNPPVSVAKPYASIVSPANDAQSAPTKSQGSSPSGSRRNSTHSKKLGPKKPSFSYAQMLYPKNGPTTSIASNSQSKSLPTSSHKKTEHPVSNDPSDWHTVKGKKSADPCILSPTTTVQTTTPSPRQPSKPEPVVSDDDEEEVKSDDPEAERKRQKRRIKRQKLKEANRQQKQQEKEQSRQDSVDKDSPPPQNAPAFDRNNLAARRKKRQELQRKTEFSESNNSSTSSAPTPTITPTIYPIIPQTVTGNPMNASITAGQTAMAAYGLSGAFRHSGSPFAVISPGGRSTLPLFLPPQDGLRTNKDDGNGTILIEEMDEAPLLLPVRSTKPAAQTDTPTLRMEIDENAKMIEKLLMFDSLEKMSKIDMPESDRATIAKGLEDIKKMYVRVEKAGQLVSYKTGSSKVTQKVEEKLMNLTIKLLSNRVELNQVDDNVVSEIGSKIAHCSSSFNYTNYLSALLDFAQIRATELPEGTNLRKNYEQSVVLTKVFMKRTKALFEKVVKYYNFTGIEEELA